MSVQISGMNMNRFLSFLFIFSTLVLFFNNAANWHYHQLPNGVIIEHAHPYGKTSSPANSPFEKHHHSDFEYLILELVYYSGLVIILVVLSIRTFRKSKPRQQLLKPLPVVRSVYSRLPLLRAPPVI
jgi:hypothetical protein